MSEGAVGEGVGEGSATPAVPPATPQGASAILGTPEGTPASAQVATPATPAEPPAWANGLDNDAMTLVSNKGWDKADNPMAEALKGYANLERLRGVSADKLVRIPEAGNEEQMAEFRARMGVPESAEGYESPELVVNGAPVDMGIVSSLSHRIAATPDQHAELSAGVGELLANIQQEQTAALSARLSAEQVELKNEWGALNEENTLAAKKGFGALEWDPATIDAIEAAVGHKAVMKAAALVGRMTGEHSRGDSGEGSSGGELAYGLTREAAQAQLRSDGAELMAKATNGDKSAADRLKNLNKVAWHG